MRGRCVRSPSSRRACRALRVACRMSHVGFARTSRVRRTAHFIHRTSRPARGTRPPAGPEPVRPHRHACGARAVPPGGTRDEGTLLARQAYGPIRDCRGPGHRGPARRDRRGSRVLDRRRGPASVRRGDPRPEGWRRARPRMRRRGRRDRRWRIAAARRRARRRAVRDRVRRVRPVPARQLVGMRDDEPAPRAGRQGVRPRHRRPARLRPSGGRLSGRAGAIRARAARGRRARDDTGRRRRRARCSSATASRPAGRRSRSARSSRATSSRCGARGRWGCSRR